MKNYIYHVLFVFLLFLIQVSAMKAFASAPVWFPQLLLLWIVIFALTHSFTETLWLGFIAGFFLEFFSGAFFGGMIVAMVLTGATVYVLTRKLTPQEMSLPISAVLVVLLTPLFPFWVFLYEALLSMFGIAPGLALEELYSFAMIWTVISNLVVFYPLNLVFNFLFAKR